MRRRSANEKPRLPQPSLPHPPAACIQTCYHIFAGVRIGECVERNKTHRCRIFLAIATDHEHPA
jgi:hypothetical protein